MTTSSNDLEPAIDELYGLPLTDFIRKRNALAKKLRSEGDRDAADRVQALPKATRTAWAANQIVLRHHESFLTAVRAGEAVRRALKGEGSVPQSVASRRKAIDRLVELADRELRKSGAAPGLDALRRVGRTLEALTTAPPEEVVPGRLAGDLEPPGFEALVGMSLKESPPGRNARTRKGAGRRKPAPQPKTSKKPGPGARSRAGSPTERAIDKRASAAEVAGIERRRSELRELIRELRARAQAAERGRRTATRALDRTTRALAMARERVAECEADLRAAHDRVAAAKAAEKSAAEELAAAERELKKSGARRG